MRAKFLTGLVGLWMAGVAFGLGGCGDDGAPVDAGPEPTCDDGIFNGDEVDTDCGGPTCDPCGAGLACAEDADCISLICDDTNTCQRSRCNDEILNGSETDVDCGGDDCLPCPADAACETGSDCLSLACSDPGEDGLGRCIDPCIDGAVSAGERGVDCGGVCLTPCPVGTGCIENRECDSGVCDGLICAEPACDDTVQNGDETDLDCGGGTCDGCAPGRACEEAEDCSSFVCTDEICAEPTCDDGVANGDETDVDCGGQTCGPCPDLAACIVSSDCQSKVCDRDAGICQAPTCEDEVSNGDESGIDCGGVDCPGCPNGAVCRNADDCLADSCFFGGCGEPVLVEFGDDTGYTGSQYAEWPGEVCPATTDAATAISLSDDGRVEVALPSDFDYRFYGREISRLWINMDGAISFDDVNLTPFTNSTFCPPYSNPGSWRNTAVEVIAAWWDDMNPGAGGEITWEIVGDAPNRRFVVNYTEVGLGFSWVTGDQNVSYRIVLDEGTDIIHVCYIDGVMEARSFESQGNAAISGLNRGNGATGDGITFGCFDAVLTSGRNLLYRPTGLLPPPDEEEPPAGP